MTILNLQQLTTKQLELYFGLCAVHLIPGMSPGSYVYFAMMLPERTDMI